jgi:hypothetical protein
MEGQGKIGVYWMRLFVVDFEDRDNPLDSKYESVWYSVVQFSFPALTRSRDTIALNAAVAKAVSSR